MSYSSDTGEGLGCLAVVLLIAIFVLGVPLVEYITKGCG